MKKKLILGALVAIFFVCAFFGQDVISEKFSGSKNYLSATFFSMGIQVKDLVAKYADGRPDTKVKILLVAGHEPNFGGAEYRDLEERKLNLQLAEKIKELLAKNPNFEIIMARDDNGWDKELNSYVLSNAKDIFAWVAGMKREMFGLAKQGKVTLVSSEIGHSIAPASSQLFLYGLNKWASTKNIDITLHIHFNDNPKHQGLPRYQGFSIYVPEKQYSNSSSSQVLAQDLMKEISKIQIPSTLPEENSGVVEDQELIALGSYNTADSLSVLVEYAYIYENVMQNQKSREAFIDRVAQATAKGLEQFFESRKSKTPAG